MSIHVDGLRADDDDFDEIINREIYLKALRARIEQPLKEMMDMVLKDQSGSVDILFPIGAQTYTQSILEWMKEYLLTKQNTDVIISNAANKNEFMATYSWTFLHDYYLGRVRFARTQQEKVGFWPTSTIESQAQSMHSNTSVMISVCRVLEPSEVSIDLDAVESG